MKSRLNAEDGRAVDLLLERPDGRTEMTPVETIFTVPLGRQFEQRLQSTETILEILSAMPAAEPSSDLVSRTMQRIEQAELEPSASQRQVPTLSNPDLHA